MDFPDFMGWREHLQVRPKCRGFRLTFCLRPILWRFELFWTLWVFGTVPSQTVNELSRTREVGTKVSADVYLAHQRIWGSPKFCEHSGMKEKRYTTVTTGLFVYAFGARWIPNVTHSNKTFGASKNFLGESAHTSIPEIRKPGEGCDRRKLKNFKHFFRTPTTWIISWVKEDKPENWIRVGFH